MFLGKKRCPEKPAATSKVEEKGKLYEGKVGGWPTHQTSGPQLSGAWTGLTSGNGFLCGVFSLTLQIPGNSFSPWKPSFNKFCFTSIRERKIICEKQLLKLRLDLKMNKDLDLDKKHK